jgi:hypothetical protein
MSQEGVVFPEHIKILQVKNGITESMDLPTKKTFS